ncbi:hypothetical protein RGQ29_029551 [Quercus rubra]|uniref:Uncharacterized protein n=1 Tax=Quercus rubra TaxID=3512 RepID=A0AAN7EF43_QUERU|nr:hypothetical protein RGQ29_029551 [Quercus rubra]
MTATWTKSLFKHTENRERRKNSDKSSSPQPSLFHLCLPNPPPHHTPELTATEFAGAVRENELRKPVFHLCLPKPPPHHTPKLTAIEVAGAVREAWKHTGAAVSHDPKRALQKLRLKVYLLLEMYRIHYNNFKKVDVQTSFVSKRMDWEANIFFGYIMFKLWWIDIEPSFFFCILNVGSSFLYIEL